MPKNAKPSPFSPQPRDFSIINIISSYKLVSADHIRALVKGPRSKIYERLQRLEEHKYISSQQRSVNDKRYYKPPRTPVLSQTEHSLGISTFRACLTIAIDDTPSLSLEESPIKQLTNTKTVKPDFTFFIRLKEHDGYYDQFYCLEYDNHTMNRTDEYATKYTNYYHWCLNHLNAGGTHSPSPTNTIVNLVENLLVLTVTTDKQRTETLKRIVQAYIPKEAWPLFLFKTQDYKLDDQFPVLRNWEDMEGRKHTLME